MEGANGIEPPCRVFQPAPNLSAMHPWHREPSRRTVPNFTNPNLNNEQK